MRGIKKKETHEAKLTLASSCDYSLDCHRTKLNNNVIVVGASGTGKTSSIVSPNICRCYGSYVISDPKGVLYDRHKELLEAKGYRVIKLDFTHPESSAHYNPLAYIRSFEDAKRMAHAIIYGAGVQNSRDAFWVLSAEMLLTSILGYMWMEAPEYEQNITMIYDIVNAMEIPPEGDPYYKAPVDLLYEEYEENGGMPSICNAHKNIRCVTPGTFSCIRAELGSVLSRFDSPAYNEMLSRDEIELDKLGNTKTALFVVASETDRSMDMLVNLFFSQAFHVLYQTADDVYGGRLPIAVQFIMDDFATSAKIEDFPRMISSFRSRYISSMIILQAENQLRSLYGCDAETIISNCDSYVYLGGSDIETARNMATRSGASVKSILQMPIGSAWIFRRGSKPVYAKQNKGVF